MELIQMCNVLHVLFDACEYKAAKITKLNKEFLFVVNFELI